MAKEFLLQKVTYWRRVRPPSVGQYLVRRMVREVMTAGKDITGVGFDADSGRPIPISAQAAKMRLKGLTADDIAREHPEWVEEYKHEQLLEKEVPAGRGGQATP